MSDVIQIIFIIEWKVLGIMIKTQRWIEQFLNKLKNLVLQVQKKR